MYLRMSNMCSHNLDVQEQTSVSHSATESEIISLDAGLRMDGLPALDLWDVVTEVLHSFQNTHTHTHSHQRVGDRCRKEKVDGQATGNRARGEILSTNPNNKFKRSGHRDVDESSSVDHVVTSAKPSRFEVLLYFLKTMKLRSK